jgi:YggT family protein
VFGWSLMSMFAPDPRHPLQRLLGTIVDPLLRPLRGKLAVGMIDFSPTVVIVGLLLARMLVAQPLLDLGTRLAVIG